MQVFNKAVFILATLLLCFACDQAPRPCIKSTGTQSQKTLAVSTFKTLALYDDIEILLIQDSINYVEVSAGEGILPFIEISESNEVLSIRDENKCKWMRSLKNQIKAVVHFTELDSIFYNGTGNVSNLDKIELPSFSFMGLNSSGSIALNLIADSLTFQFQTGVADLKLSGQSEYLFVYVSGDAPLDCRTLSTKTAHINHTGSNLVSVNVSDKLIVENWHYGDLAYEGEPTQIIQRGNGSGKLIKLN